jgi:hypothetical protein
MPLILNYTDFKGKHEFKARITRIRADIIFKEESYKIIGICREVHRAWGRGSREAVYQEAPEPEFQEG